MKLQSSIWWKLGSSFQSSQFGFSNSLCNWLLCNIVLNELLNVAQESNCEIDCKDTRRQFSAYGSFVHVISSQ